MLEQLGALIQALLSLFPRLFIVRSTHAAVKFVRGSQPALCGPGVHWYWPVVTEVEEVSTVRDTLNTESQALTAADGTAFVSAAVLVYRSSFPVLTLTKTTDYEDTLCDITLTAVADVLAGKTFEEIVDAHAIGEVEGQLLAIVQDRLSPFGIVVDYAGFTELCPVHAYKHFGISPGDSTNG